MSNGKRLIIVGDVVQSLRGLSSESVHCVVTSPPYWGLRDYGVDGQIGSEPTPDEYVAKMVEVFREVRRVLRSDGTLWLNLGDCYSHGIPGGGCVFANGRTDGRNSNESDKIEGRVKMSTLGCGLPEKNMVGIPWRVALALQADGWWLRQDIIWAKPNPMPSSVTDRCTTAHEYMFLLTKSPRYYFDARAIAEPAAEPTRRRCDKVGGASWEGRQQHSEGGVSLGHETRNKRDVWWIGTQSYKGAHFATFPETLVEPCILAGTSERGCCDKCGAPYVRQVEKHRQATRPGRDTKVAVTSNKQDNTGNRQYTGFNQRWRESAEVGNRDPARHVTTSRTVGWSAKCDCNSGVTPCTVLDPFMGSGTTLTVAKHYGRSAIGIELNSDYASLAVERIKKGCTRVGKPAKTKRPLKDWELMEADDADAA